MASASPTAVPAPSPRLPFPLSPREGWVTVILAVVVVQITIAAMISLQWTKGLSILTSTALVGMGLGFIMSKQRLVPQWLAEIPAQILGIGFAFRQTAMVQTGGSFSLLLRRLGFWVQSTFAGQSSSDDAIFLLFLAILTMLLGYVSMWLIFRSRSPWLAIVSNAIVLLISIVYSADDKSFFVVVFMLSALLLLVRCNLVERMRIWRRKGLRYAPEIGWDFMQAGVLFTVVVMLLGYILPSNYANTTLEDLWNGPTSPWSQLQNRFTQVFQVQGAGNGPTGVGFGSGLAISGDVNLPSTPIFSYTYTAPAADADLADSAYLLGLTYDTYDGKGWTLGKTTTKSLAAQQDLAPDPNHFAPVQESISVLAAPNGPYIYALGQPGAFSLPNVALSDLVPDQTGQDSYVARQLKTNLAKNQSYKATSYVSTATVAELRSVPAPSLKGDANYPAALLQHYTALPSEFFSQANESVRAAANQWTTTTPDGKTVPNTMYDKLEAIISYFATPRFHYSTQNPAPDAGHDAAWSLLKTNQGYCTWYATTLAVMARYLGYPARVVAGFAHGSADQGAGSDLPTGTSSKASVYTVLGTDAHAWVQVYFAGYGWINFEASVASSAFQEFSRGTADTTGTTTAPTTPTAVAGSPTPAAGATATPGAGNTTGAQNQNPVVQAADKVAISLSLLLTLGLLALLAIGAWWRLLFRAFSPVSQTFARMALLGGLTGVRAKPAQTASEYGELLAEHHPDQRRAIQEITESYVNERWAPDPPNMTTIGARWQQLRVALVKRVPGGIGGRVARLVRRGFRR